ncbi:MAG: YwqG family protein [Verrucomicrobiota bacterium JB022]|nr:YwqG family protein [Verrucomicrobiota bacterium JB022]
MRLHALVVMGWFDRIFGQGDRQKKTEVLPLARVEELEGWLRELAEPTYFLGAGPRDSRTYLGGMPMGGESFEWPRSARGPLPFVLQVDLTQLQAQHGPVEALPDKGLLQFYYDLGSSVWGGQPTDGAARAWFVQLVEADLVLPIEEPDDLNPEYIYPRKHLAARAGVTYPAAPPALHGSPENAFLAIREAAYGGEPQHQLLGCPLEIQDGQQALHCVKMAWGLSHEDWQRRGAELQPQLAEELDKWILLAQIDSDDATQMMWGDVGKLFFWIRKDDLARRRFERCWMIFECY